VRREAARYALAAMTLGACNGLDHRRYGLPEAGHALRGRATTVFGHNRKIANCQVAASLTIATRTEHVPVDFALYLPESWTEDPSRRPRPTSRRVTFKTKPELGSR